MKQTIKLSGSEFRQIITETVKKVLREDEIGDDFHSEIDYEPYNGIESGIFDIIDSLSMTTDIHGVAQNCIRDTKYQELADRLLDLFNSQVQ